MIRIQNDNYKNAKGAVVGSFLVDYDEDGIAIVSDETAHSIKGIKGFHVLGTAPEPENEPEPESAPAPGPVKESEQESTPELTKESEPVPDAETAPDTETAPELVPETEPTKVREPVQTIAPNTNKAKGRPKKATK